jgi:hypothetical protein
LDWKSLSSSINSPRKDLPSAPHCSKARRSESPADDNDDEDEFNGYKNQEAAVQQATIDVEQAKDQRKYFVEISALPG